MGCGRCAVALGPTVALSDKASSPAAASGGGRLVPLSRSAGRRDRPEREVPSDRATCDERVALGVYRRHPAESGYHHPGGFGIDPHSELFRTRRSFDARAPAAADPAAY